MTDNLLIPLPTLRLPGDFPWRVKFIAAVEDHLRQLHATGRFSPPRFFGYYFQGEAALGVCGKWTVSLDPEPTLDHLADTVDRVTLGQFPIASEAGDREPDFLLIHDRHDGACWLWRFAYGLRFVEATQPVWSRRA